MLPVAFFPNFFQNWRRKQKGRWILHFRVTKIGRRRGIPANPWEFLDIPWYLKATLVIQEFPKVSQDIQEYPRIPTKLLLGPFYIAWSRTERILAVSVLMILKKESKIKLPRKNLLTYLSIILYYLFCSTHFLGSVLDNNLLGICNPSQGKSWNDRIIFMAVENPDVIIRI